MQFSNSTKCNIAGLYPAKSCPVLQMHCHSRSAQIGAHYLTSEIKLFAEKRRAAQSAGKKPSDMWTAGEMAKALGIKPEFIQRFVYEPLRGLFDQRHSRQQEIVFDRDSASAAANDNIFVNGQRFAIGTTNYPGMGYFGTSANDTSFCISKDAKDACRFALYGKLPEPKRYYYNETMAARVLSTDIQKLRETSDAIIEAYHTRDPYQRSLFVRSAKGPGEGVDFTLQNDVVFCLDRNIPKLFFTADGLRKLYQLEHDVSDTKSTQWWQAHSDKLYQVKTPRWRNKDEVMVDLGIHSGHKDYASFDKVWKQIEREQKSHKPKMSDEDAGIHAGLKRDEVAPSGRAQLCVTVDSIDRIRDLMVPEGIAGGAHASKAGGKRGPTSGRA